MRDIKVNPYISDTKNLQVTFQHNSAKMWCRFFSERKQLSLVFRNFSARIVPKLSFSFSRKLSTLKQQFPYHSALMGYCCDKPCQQKSIKLLPQILGFSNRAFLSIWFSTSEKCFLFEYFFIWLGCFSEAQIWLFLTLVALFGTSFEQSWKDPDFLRTFFCRGLSAGTDAALVCVKHPEDLTRRFLKPNHHPSCVYAFF